MCPNISINQISNSDTQKHQDHQRVKYTMELIQRERVGSLELAYLKTIPSYEPKCPILAQASGVCVCVW